MNKVLRNILLIAASVFAFASCDNDATKDYGYAYVYIPQATTSGLDNSYTIPQGAIGQNSVYSCYFKDGKLNIALGAIRSGYLKEQKGFTVDLRECQSQTDRKLKEYSERGVPAMELPSSVVTCPDKITVPQGDNYGSCYVAVDLVALSKDSSIIEDDTYKLLVMGLEIVSPSEYELAENNTSVVIILDLNSQVWDDVAENKPESEIRNLFPLL